VGIAVLLPNGLSASTTTSTSRQGYPHVVLVDDLVHLHDDDSIVKMKGGSLNNDGVSSVLVPV